MSYHVHDYTGRGVIESAVGEDERCRDIATRHDKLARYAATLIMIGDDPMSILPR